MDIVTLAASRKYTDKKIMESAAVGIKYEIVDSLPSSGEAQTIYFVKSDNSLINNYYDEYVWISSSSAFEKIGSTQINEAPVQSVNGKTGAVELTARDVGAISQDNLQEATNTALAQAKASGEFDGADGKSAYQYAQESGYTGTEEEFAAKLASEALIVTITDNNGTLTASKSYIEIRDAILAGTTVLVDYYDTSLPLIALAADFMWFGAIQCANDEEGALVATEIIEITENNEVNVLSAQIDIPKTMPNPNALTFTGAVTGSYDGSAPLSVKIPSAVTDAHINSLIDTKLGVIENGSY